jgi:serine/threonine-protein kinase
MPDEAEPGDSLVQVRAALPKVGDVVVGKYRIEKVVGEGGMGVVFAARHEALDQLVAVKVLLADAAKGDGVIERFVREAQAAARLQSEHVARVFDAGSLENDTPFLVMEYLEGCDLEELLELNKTLPVADACDYILQALAAMAQAHAVGIIHRDLKPANLYLAVRPDGTNVIKILDFGISKQTTTTGREKALTGRAVLGSPAYMPPEQLRNAKGVDFRADIWALGIVLYEMLTGAPPFDGEGVGEIFAAVLEKDPAPIRDKRPDVPPELEAVILKALARKADDRWQNVADLAIALAPFGSGKWSGLVETIEQTLERSRRLRTMNTPPELRTMVDSAVAVAEKNDRPFETGPASAKVAFTRTDQHTAIIGRPTLAEATPPRRGRTGMVVAMLTLVILGGAAFVTRGIWRPIVARPVVQAARPAPPPPPPAAPEPEPAAETADMVATPTLTTPPTAGDNPPTPTASIASARPPKRGVRATPRPAPSPAPSVSGTRPKFLNSRE